VDAPDRQPFFRVSRNGRGQSSAGFKKVTTRQLMISPRSELRAAASAAARIGAHEVR
jgi:hypothetical protein